MRDSCATKSAHTGPGGTTTAALGIQMQQLGSIFKVQQAIEANVLIQQDVLDL